MKCCVPSCGITSDNCPATVVNNQEQVTFHEFPTTPWLRESWLLTIGIQECFLPQEAVVCSQHFQKDDFSETTSGIMTLKKSSVPSTFNIQYSPNCETSTIEFCLICLDSSASKLFLLNQNNNLAQAYTNITGHDVSDIRDHINTVPKLCPECAQRLTNCVTFKDKILRAHSLLIQLLQKDKIITSQSLNSVNRLENQLISNLGKLTYEPNHCDLYVIKKCVKEDNTQKKNIIYYPEENIKNIKSEHETMSNCENSKTYCEIKCLNVQAINDSIKHDIGDDIYDDIKHNIHDINNDIDIDEYYDNGELANDSHSSYRLINQTKVCDNSENRVSLNKLTFIEDSKPIIDDGIDHDIDELLNENYSNDKLLNKLKIANNSDNRVSLNNVIFVKDTRSMIQHKDFIPRQGDTNQNRKRVYNEIKRTSKTNVQTITALNYNKILTKQNSSVCKEVMKLKNGTDKIITAQINDDEYKNRSNLNYRKSNKKRLPPRVRAQKISGQRSCRKRNKKPQTHIPRPRTQDCTEENLKSFTVSWLTYEEQIADVQKRKDSIQYKRSAYKCEICFKGSGLFSTHNQHMEKHTDKYGKFECAICGIHCNTRDRLYIHIVRNHSERYSCKLCKFTANSRFGARNHARWHSGKSFKCPHCGAEFSKRTSYFSHVRLKHPSDSVCALCGFSFVSPAGVRSHISLRHRFEDVHNLSGPSCEECNIRFASETAYQQHMAVSPKHAISGSELKRNQAPRIRNPALYESDRYKQRKRRHDKMCELCGKKFLAAAHLRDHMHIHTGQKPYKCEICPKRFASMSNCKAHMNIHGDKPPRFPCEVCHKEFTHVSNRRRHMLSHQDTRPLYKCDICEKTFTAAVGRDQHVTHVHLKVPRPKRNRRDRTSI